MTKNWPSFITIDLGMIEADDAEMLRRWENYDREMKVIIASGIAHQDEDGWWVETATGALIGPDPDIAHRMTFAEALPELAASIRRTREVKRED